MLPSGTVHSVEDRRLASSNRQLRRLTVHRQGEERLSYAWNEKRTKMGFEEPINDHNHAPDALRYYVHTRIGNWRIVG
jgi:hypothetical protein